MKIAICGSMSFACEMLETKTELERLGHATVVPANVEKYSTGERCAEAKWEKIEEDVIRRYFEEIGGSDAVLVVNKDKNGIPGYIGGTCLIEIAFAHVLRKKIFLMNPVPTMHYADEIAAMEPTIIGGDLSRIT